MNFFLILLLLSIVILQSAKLQLVEAQDPYNVTLGVAQVPFLNVTPSVINETINHGSSSIVDVNVSNLGNMDMTNVTVYNISESDPIKDWITISSNSLDTIIPLESKEFNVTISVPSGTSGGTYSSEINISSNETGNTTIPLEVTVPGWGTTTTTSGNGGNGNGGNGNGGTGDGTTTTITTSIEETTTTVPGETTTIIECTSTGEACSLDSDCCSGYCCDNVCSDTECKMRAQSNLMYLLLLAVIGGSATSYYVYRKYHEKKIGVKIKPAIPTAAPVKKPVPVVKPQSSLRTKLLKELESLIIITQQLKTQGHDVREVENEIALSYNALKKNLPQSSAIHLNRGLKKVKQIVRKE